MNRTSFLNLVNLYLDGKITPQERIQLEGALRQHAEYRELFSQYSRLHAAACRALEQTVPEQASTLPPAPQWRPGFFPALKLAAGLVVAALLAVTWMYKETVLVQPETTVAALPQKENREAPPTLPYRIIRTATVTPSQPTFFQLSHFEAAHGVNAPLFDPQPELLENWLSLDPESPAYSVELMPVAAPNESPFAGN